MTTLLIFCDALASGRYFEPVNDTVRGIIIFVAVLITIGIWAPLRNRPERLPSGAALTETYFGVFTYLTLRTETKEPEYKMDWIPNYKRLLLTSGVTIGLWITVFAAIKRRSPNNTVPSQ